ncbi:hypothetical protein BX600DRAFT_244962 [Xylariales sp. PMI_506]|nr:hypothetical protein BX600DRAFT_244962 [Xylariales sp. PMI_506]
MPSHQHTNTPSSLYYLSHYIPFFHRRILFCFQHASHDAQRRFTRNATLGALDTTPGSHATKTIYSVILQPFYIYWCAFQRRRGWYPECLLCTHSRSDLSSLGLGRHESYVVIDTSKSVFTVFYRELSRRMAWAAVDGGSCIEPYSVNII